MKIDLIKPYPRNAKVHSKKQIDLIAKSIKEFGFKQPIVIDKNNEVIIGHARLEAAKQLGLKEVPTIDASDLTDKQVKALRLADNKLAELATWDMNLAIEELKGLDNELIDLTGFDRDLLISPDEKDDIIPDSAPTRAKLGDIWALGRHRVGCMDSTIKENVEKLMDGKKANRVFTDPPYGINLDTDYSKMGSKLKFIQEKHLKNKAGNKYEKVIGDNIEYNPKHIFDFFGYCNEIFLWGADYLLKRLPLGGMFVWDKRGNETFDKMWGSGFELCWSRQKHKRDIIRKTWAGVFGTEKEDVRNRVHPTQKPIDLCNFFITKFSKENDIMVDTFLGSGSTLIACEKTNRICYGCEISPAYCDVIIKRWEDFTNGTAKKIKST